MKKIKKCLFMRMSLVDQTLIIIMVILMVQMALSLFIFGETNHSNEIDIIVRTTAASIFGYFLSGNFTKSFKPKIDCTVSAGFEERKSDLKQEQVIVVSVFGISALLILIIVRNTMDYTPYVQVTVNQLRDFVSGCVGFLVGSPCKNKTSSN